MGTEGVQFRSWDAGDVVFLWEMLYQSLHVRPGQPPFPRTVLDSDDIAHYLRDFGQRAGDDAELGVDATGQPIGAAWCRRMTATDSGYGYVADDVPELGMAVIAEWRGQGVGRQVLQILLARHPKMSLSVDEENLAATALYTSLGFVRVTTIHGSTTMMRNHASP